MSADQLTMRVGLARDMDLKSVDAKRVDKEQAEKLKNRREIALKRADAAIRFFLKDDNLARLINRAAIAKDEAV